MRRCYLGVDWGDRTHAVAVGDEGGAKVAEMKVEESVEGMAESAEKGGRYRSPPRRDALPAH